MTILVAGASGFAGSKIFKALQQRYSHVLGTRHLSQVPTLIPLDVTDPTAVRLCIGELLPDAIIYAVGAEVSEEANGLDRVRCVSATAITSFATCFRGHFVYLSCDCVFDGTSPPYWPGDRTSARSPYGTSKAEGERLTLELFDPATIVRFGPLYGSGLSDRAHNCLRRVVEHLDNGCPVELGNSVVRTYTSVDDLASFVLGLVRHRRSGIFHVADDRALSDWEFARTVADIYFGIFPQAIVEEPRDQFKQRLLTEPEVLGSPKCLSLVSSLGFNQSLERMRDTVRSLSRRLKGGSHSRTFRLEHNGLALVRKEAYAQGRTKLVQEIAWLLALPKELRRHFPTVIDDERTGKTVAYEMPWYQLPTLTSLIIDHRAPVGHIYGKVRNVLRFCTAELYPSVRMTSQPEYARAFLIGKISERVAETRRLAPSVFGPLFDAETLTINGVTHQNALHLLDRIAADSRMLARLQPPFFTRIHGDLHFDNILVNPENDNDFILVDPRGDTGGDPVYDLAKLTHTIVGKYDFFNYDLHRIAISRGANGPKVDLQMPIGTAAWRTYESLEEQLPGLLNSVFVPWVRQTKDPFWSERLAFTHASLFLSDTSFHLKGDDVEARAAGIYVRGVTLLNEFMASFGEIARH
jgi:dTDP-4-dehydrorhamnose reductase